MKRTLRPKINIITLALVLVIFLFVMNIEYTQYPSTLLIVLTSVFLAFFIYSISYINHYFIDPLHELKRAADHIESGDLNYPIVYLPNSEIGEFCTSFDKMRIRLKNTITDQQENERQKKQFIASISHDLKTPLTTIQGYIEALQDGIVKDKEMYDFYLSTIHEKAEELNHLIDDLSVYSKQDIGEFKLNIERIHSGRFLNHYFENKMLSTPIQLILKKPFIATYIRIDVYRFTQILDNLFNNAKKYTKNQIIVSTKVVHYHLQISIEDNGIGIAEKNINYLFEPFFMVDKEKDQREKRGSGLGLSITKELIEAHGGSIFVESVLHKGSVFTIDIPIDH